MTSKHLKFEELSDLIDDDIPLEKKEDYMTHISDCKECREEYESLLECKALLSSLNEENLPLPDFSQSTITIYKRREKKRLLLKVIPAIAASVIMVAGIGFIKGGSFNKKSTSHLASNIAGQNDTQHFMEHIDNLKWRVVQVNNSYIDTELDKAMLANIEKQLYNQNIRHAIIINPALARNPLEKIVDDVSFVGTKRTIINDYNYIPSENKRIVVRIFKNKNPLTGE
jgi:hypothetical protein